MILNGSCVYCKSGNIRGTLIFADFAQIQQARIQNPQKFCDILYAHFGHVGVVYWPVCWCKWVIYSSLSETCFAFCAAQFYILVNVLFIVKCLLCASTKCQDKQKVQLWTKIVIWLSKFNNPRICFCAAMRKIKWQRVTVYGNKKVLGLMWHVVSDNTLFWITHKLTGNFSLRKQMYASE